VKGVKSPLWTPFATIGGSVEPLASEIGSRVAFLELGVLLAPHLVDDPPALDRRARRDCVDPARDVLVIVDAQEGLGLVVDRAEYEGREPREVGDVGEGVFLARQEPAVRKPLVGDIEDALGLHRIAIDRIFDLLGRIGVEVTEAATHERPARHLPEGPGEHLGARGRIGGEEHPELFGQVHEDRPALEHPDRGIGVAAVKERRDLRIGIHRDKAAGKLFSGRNVDRPCVILCRLVAGLDQLFEHDCRLHPIGGGERIELEGVRAHGQVLVLARASGGAVDGGEAAAAHGVGVPDLGGNVGGVGHWLVSVGREGRARCRDCASGVPERPSQGGMSLGRHRISFTIPKLAYGREGHMRERWRQALPSAKLGSGH
jgi:hypothetical protein